MWKNQRRSPFVIKASSLTLVAMIVSACASAVAPPPCPQVRLLADGAKLTRFAPGPGRDIIDIVHEEKITGFAQGCEFETDDTGAGTLTVWAAPTIVSSRGPANTSGRTEFSYFIAATDAQKNILRRDRYDRAFTYTRDVPRIRWQNPEPEKIILPLKAGQNGKDFLVYLSLVLTRDELDYRRKNR